jgi:hypothetical protein
MIAEYAAMDRVDNTDGITEKPGGWTAHQFPNVGNRADRRETMLARQREAGMPVATGSHCVPLRSRVGTWLLLCSWELAPMPFSTGGGPNLWRHWSSSSGLLVRLAKLLQKREKGMRRGMRKRRGKPEVSQVEYTGTIDL